MVKTIIVFVFCVLTLFGVVKILELIEGKITLQTKLPIYLVCRLNGKVTNAEILIRSLAKDSQNLSSGENSGVIIVNDAIDKETEEICYRTAQQLNNVSVLKIDKISEFIEQNNT